MSILARLAHKVVGLSGELAATDALGVLLEDPVGAAALTAAVRLGSSHLPEEIRYSTQAADADGRPDVVGRDAIREVIHVEGKFWAGLTEAQADGSYKRRLQKQWMELAPNHPHSGVLVFVCPPRRLSSLWSDLEGLYDLKPRAITASWRFGESPDGFVVGATSWRALLDPIEAVAAQPLAEDVRQLRALVDQVDSQSFVPWTTEQLTDQESARRVVQLADLVESIWDNALKKEVASPYGRRQSTTKIGVMAYGKLLKLGGVAATLKVSPWLWAEHGRSPLWLTFTGGAQAARKAFPEETVEIYGGRALSVPLRPGALEHEIVSQVTTWLGEVGQKLEHAVLAGASLSPEVVEDVSETSEPHE
ncbi:hypothetical protein [Blastococcus sp. SYSU DS0539]